MFRKTLKIGGLRLLGFIGIGTSTICENDTSPKDQTNTKKVLGVGVAALDYIASVKSFPEPDAKIRTTSLQIAGGGNVANTLTAISRLDQSTTIVSKIGNDANGQFILNGLHQDNIDTSSMVISTHEASGIVYVIVDPQTHTRTCIATFPTEISSTETNQLIENNILNNISLMHLDSRHTEAAYLLTQKARQLHIPITIDVEKDRPPYLLSLLPLCDVVFTNETFTETFLKQNETYQRYQNHSYILSPHHRIIHNNSHNAYESIVISNNSIDVEEDNLLQRLITMEALFHIPTSHPSSSISISTSTNDSSIHPNTATNNNHIHMIVSTMGGDGSVLMKKMTDNDNNNNNNNKRVSNVDNSVFSMLQSVDTSENILYDRNNIQNTWYTNETNIPINTQSYTFTVLRNDDSANITDTYEVIRCSAWPMKTTSTTSSSSSSSSSYTMETKKTSDDDDDVIVDTTGAGDGYIGGFIVGLLNKFSDEECMVLGTAVAAEKLKYLGARYGLPTKEKIKQKLHITDW